MSLQLLDGELSTMNAFLESHRTFGNGELSARVENSMVQSWVAKMKSASLDAAALTQLNTNVAAMQCISETGKAQLGAALGDAAVAASSTVAPNSLKSAQYMSHPQNYPEADVWDVIASTDASLHSKIQTAVECYVAKGLVHPNEKTVKSIAALLASSHWPDGSPAGAARHDLVLNVKQWFKAQRVGREPTPYIVVFPAEPTQLPNYTQLYNVDKPPKSFTPCGFMREHALMVMRSTNKQVRSTTDIRQLNQSVPHFHANPPQANPLEMFATLMTNMMSGNVPARNNSPPELQFTFNRPRPQLPGLESLGSSGTLPSDAEEDRAHAINSLGPGVPLMALPAPQQQAAVSPTQHTPLTQPSTSQVALSQEPAPARSPSPPDTPQADNVLDYGNAVQEAIANRAAAKPAGASAKKNTTIKKKPAANAIAKASVKKVATPKKASLKAACRPPCPTGPGTVFYNGGKIHFSEALQAFRVFENAKDRCDKKVKWQPTRKAGWQKALDLIDGI